MPYYSVRIDGGADRAEASREIREMFGARDADYTSTPSFFYVERHYDAETLKQNIDGVLAGEYRVVINEIEKDEYNWRSSRR